MNLLKKPETYRLENKISQQTLAKERGVAFSTINCWFTGKTKPNKIGSSPNRVGEFHSF